MSAETVEEYKEVFERVSTSIIFICYNEYLSSFNLLYLQYYDSIDWTAGIWWHDWCKF